MVQLTKDSIVITIDSDTPFLEWQQLQESMIHANLLLLVNEEFPAYAYNLVGFNKILEALSKLDLSTKQTKVIERICITGE